MRTLVVARQPRQLLLAALVLAVLTTVSVAVMSSVFIAPLPSTPVIPVSRPLPAVLGNEPAAPRRDPAAAPASTSYESMTHEGGLYEIVPNRSGAHDPESGTGMAGYWWLTTP